LYYLMYDLSNAFVYALSLQVPCFW
jgi:hypothetical protein